MAQDPIISAAESRVRGLRDLGNQIERTISKIEKVSSDLGNKAASSFSAMESSASSAINTNVKLAASIDSIAVSLGKLTAKENETGKSFAEAEKKVSKFNESLKKVGSTSSKLWQTFDKLSKGILKIGGSIAGIGINLLLSGIKRVYELKERWAGVIGKLNTQLGGMSSNMSQARKTMGQWEGKMHGLTGKFGAGAAMFTEYTGAMGIMDKRALDLSRTFGIELARGFNMGAKGAVNFMMAMRTMGDTNKEISLGIGQMAELAIEFDVPINTLTKDIGEASGFMLQFGKSGRKGFMQAAVHLKRFNISMKDMQKFMSSFDTLDAAVDSTSKLNVVFGTTISSLDMMLTQDPAERFEIVRQQLLAQGKTYDSLGRAEMQMLTSTLKLSENEVAAMLDTGRKKLTLNEIREKAAKSEMNERKAKKLMQKQLQKTAETLFSFSAAMDKVTRAVGRALAPLLDALGLGSKGGEKFGSVMKSATDVMVDFFDGLARSPQWISFMTKIADKMKELGKWIKTITVDDMTRMFEKVMSGAKIVYTWSKRIVAVWATLKLGETLLSPLSKGYKLMKKMKDIGTSGALGPAGINAVNAGITQAGEAGGMSDPYDIRSSGQRRLGSLKSGPGNAMRGLGGMLKRGTRMGAGGLSGALGGATAGMAIGGLTGGGSLGGTIGSGLGTAIGALGGPIGMAVGGAVGGFLGDNVEKMFPKTAKLMTSRENLAKANEKLNQEQNYSIALTTKANVEAKIFEHQRSIEINQLKRLSKSKGRISVADKKSLKQRASALFARQKGNTRFLLMMKRIALTGNASSGELKLMARHTKRAHKEADKLAQSAMSASGALDAVSAGKNAADRIKLQKQKAEGYIQEGKSGQGFHGQTKAMMKSGDFQGATQALGSSIATAIDERAKLRKDQDNNTNKLTGGSAQRLKQAKRAKEIKLLDDKIRVEKVLMAKAAQARTAQSVLMNLTRDEIKIKRNFIDIQLVELAMKKDEQLAEAIRKGGVTKDTILGNGQRISPAQLKLAKMMATATGNLGIESSVLKTPPATASGGIVTRAQNRLVGESGPEAIIPLRAMARGRGRQPTKFGGASAKKLVNYAAGNSSGGSSAAPVQIVSGDVYLDSEKVGRHLVKSMIVDS